MVVRTSVLALALFSATAHAQSPAPKWWLHVGAARVLFSPAVNASIGGGPSTPVPDATLSDNNAVGFDLGYEVRPNVVVSLMLGLPPTTHVSSPSFGGKLGSIKYGPAILSGHYHFDLGPVRPYVGAGIVRDQVFNSRDAGLTGFDVKSAWGTAIVAGVDVPLGDGWGLFLDVRKARLRTDATANGGIAARVRLDPTIVSSGLLLRF